MADLRTSIRPTVASIDLVALHHNVQVLSARLGKCAIYGVVKADAYGHGAVEMARALQGHVGALAVSLVEEGLELRAAGIRGPILVLGAHYGAQHSEVIEAGLRPVIYDFATLESFANAPVRRRLASGWGGDGKDDNRDDAPIDVHIKINTGMNRLGFAPDKMGELVAALQSHPRLRLAGVCTHMASADQPDPTPTQNQVARFEAALAQLRAMGQNAFTVHAANSATMAGFPAASYDAVRPGLALYGAMPSGSVPVPGLRPVLSLTTKVMAVHAVAPGEAVSYGGRFVANRPSRIATLPIGYPDGYPRHVRGASVLVHGHRVPLVGAVCMDMMMIDVTDVPGVDVGADVTLIGGQRDLAISVDDLADWAGTVNYEILCGISKRVPRHYHGGGSPHARANNPAGDVSGA